MQINPDQVRAKLYQMMSQRDLGRAEIKRISAAVAKVNHEIIRGEAQLELLVQIEQQETIAKAAAEAKNKAEPDASRVASDDATPTNGQAHDE